MRKNVKRGGMSSRDLYRKLRANVWREVEQLDKDMITLHDRDIQEIAVIEAERLGINDFKVELLIFIIYFGIVLG